MACLVATRKENDQWLLSGGFHWWTFVNWQYAIFLPCRHAKTLVKNIQFFFWHFFYRFWTFGATRTSNPFSNINVKIITIWRLHECVKSNVYFEILQLLRQIQQIHTIDYSHSEVYGFFVVTWVAFYIISNTLLWTAHKFVFFSFNFLSAKLGFPQKNFMPSDICCINFYIRSNVGIMVGKK